MLAVDWEWSFGALVAAILVVLGYLGHGIRSATKLGRWIGQLDKRLDVLDQRMEKLEAVAERQQDILVTLAENKAQFTHLASQIEDVRKYGSHRLAEVLEAIRGQIMSDFKERFEFLQRELERKSHDS